MTLPDALYHADGDAFVPTALCTGPWSASLSHGGPPAALLATALARHGGDASPDLALLRVTVDLIRPIPLVPARTSVRVTRAGSQAWWLTAELHDLDGRLLALAHGLRIRQVAAPVPGATPCPRPAPPSPDHAEPMRFPFFPTDIAFHRAVDVRIVEGAWPDGPVGAWVRLEVPLVAGQPTLPIARVIAVCDAINGLSPVLSTGGWSFPNADLSLRLLRPFEGPWIGLRTRSEASEVGTGLVQGVLFDARGEVGLCAESLVVRPADGPR